jgi:hypothetical protein
MTEFSASSLTLFSLQELLELRDQVKASIFSRKTTINLSFSGKNAAYQIEIPLKEIAKAISIELRRRDPDSYGTFDDRTSAAFS